ncbi:MAG: SH3 domain-containing protein [Clostridia bacterium]|nr:SH3 domain-containing protein [Clostridia bacterium]
MKLLMKMTILSVLILILLTGMAGSVLADTWRGEVISQQVTFREAPSERSKSLGRITNGTELTILSHDVRGWFQILHEGKEGYVMDQYIVEWPEHLTLLGTVYVYAYPRSDKRVAALGAYTRLTVIDEYQQYYVVNLRQASGFISKRANVMTDTEALSSPVISTARISTRTLPRDGPSTRHAQAGNWLEVNETLAVIGKSGEWYHVILTSGRPAFISAADCLII